MVIVVVILFPRIPPFAYKPQAVCIRCTAYLLCIDPKDVFFILSLYERLAVGTFTVCGIFRTDAVRNGSGTYIFTSYLQKPSFFTPNHFNCIKLLYNIEQLLSKHGITLYTWPFINLYIIKLSITL